MAKRLSADIGTRVVRKRDGATGVISERALAVPSVAHPGIYGKTIVTIRYDAPEAFDATGDLDWLRSTFRKEAV